ncbi:MAG: hypothetical protein H6Q24_1491 [Bacteroidetes bacterium]|nr:hypothetical protein [Bacteroidota bacterium]
MVTVLRRKILIACIFLVSTSFIRTFSQNIPDCDLRFIIHLFKTGYLKETLFLLDSKDCLLSQTNDSVNYLRGWCYSLLNRLEPSSESFLKVEPASSLYHESRFYAAYNYAQTDDLIKAEGILEEIEAETQNHLWLKNYEIAGIKLLQGDLVSFNNKLDRIENYLPETSSSAINLVNISAEINSHKSKSPLLAGLFSVILPGSGKLYGGRKGEAISTFLSTAGTGLVAWENYRKNGPNDFRTIAFGALFALTYMANIYGSVFSVTVLENDFKEHVKTEVLFNMHIPLDFFFDK